MSSSSSNRPEHLRDLPAGRGEGEVVVFGRRAVLEAIGAPGARVHAVLVDGGLHADFRKTLSRRCREAGVALEVSSRAAVSALSRAPRHDQGVAARVVLERLMEMEGFLAQRTGRAARAPIRLLAFDAITNAQNIGMIVRSAVAAGIDAVLWPLRGCPWVNGLVIKSSAATLYSCPIIRSPSLIQGLGELRAAGFSCVGLSASAEHDLFEWRPAHRTVLVVGGETEGICDEAAALLDDRLAIPMARGVESLNVAVAASIACFRLAQGG